MIVMIHAAFWHQSLLQVKSKLTSLSRTPPPTPVQSPLKKSKAMDWQLTIPRMRSSDEGLPLVGGFAQGRYLALVFWGTSSWRPNGLYCWLVAVHVQRLLSFASACWDTRYHVHERYQRVRRGLEAWLTCFLYTCPLLIVNLHVYIFLHILYDTCERLCEVTCSWCPASVPPAFLCCLLWSWNLLCLLQMK